VARSTRGRKTGAPAMDSDDAELPEPESSVQPADAGGRSEGFFTEAGSFTVAALLHLVRLAVSELVLARPDLDPGPLEQAVRTKIDQFPGPTNNAEARAAGIAFARHLVEQVLAQVRAQAELKKSLNAPEAHSDRPHAPAAHPPWKLLN